ncbi:unnamed protein product (mitochondrion) [Plasmodiophora brassicae]|nr:unnamed protein product [Plasmodiophora brassicae]
MLEWLNPMVLSFLLVILVAVLFLFLDTWSWCRRFQAEGWQRINAGIVFVLLATIGTAIAQMFLVGRTDSECNILHRVSGSLYTTSEPLVRILFIARLFEFNKMTVSWERIMDRCLLMSAFLYLLAAVVTLNLTMGTAIVDNVCTAILNPAAAGLTFMLPQIIDIVTNARLWQVVKEARACSALLVLLSMTLGFFMASSAISILSLLIVLQIIPLDPAFYTVWLTFQQAFDACSIALPTIIARFMCRHITGPDLGDPPQTSAQKQPLPQTTGRELDA